MRGVKPEIKCKRIVVNINQMEVGALEEIYYYTRNRKLARAAISKVVEAWRAAKQEGAAK